MYAEDTRDKNAEEYFFYEKSFDLVCLRIDGFCFYTFMADRRER